MNMNANFLRGAYYKDVRVYGNTAGGADVWSSEKEENKFTGKFLPMYTDVMK